MKLYKSLLFGLLVCGMAACDTTDLERDINSLKDRVEDYEAQVQKLNDDMNIIRVLLDGNKTITSYSFDGANYTLTLSNGETLTLTQGVVGANYPSITIGENGNWVIAGTDSGIRAEAKDGEDAPYTPQFKIENENWCVSLDGGATWQNLGVKATGTASGTSPISSVTPATDGNSIKITLAEGNTYTIPVVKDLVCEITEPELADGEMWYIGCEATETLKVNVNIQSGDIIRPVVPAEWKAKIKTDYSSLSGAQTLEVEVTAPATASKCVVTMEVNRGVNTITDEIVARTETKSYYDDYMAGLDIKIGDFIINKATYGDAVYVDAVYVDNNNPTITTDKVYFIKDNLEINMAKVRVENYLFVIGENPNLPPTLKFGADKYFSLNSDNTEALGLFCKNIVIDGTGNTNYLSNIEGSKLAVDYKYYMMDNVRFIIEKDKSVLVITQKVDNSTGSKIGNILFRSCHFKFKDGTTTAKIVQLNGAGDYTATSVAMQNNVFYASSEGTSVGAVLYANTKTVGHFLIEKNSLIGVYPLAAQGYIQNAPDKSSCFHKNVVYIKASSSTGSYTSGANFVSSSADPAVEPDAAPNFVDNVVFDNTDMKWKCFRNKAPSGIVNTIETKAGSPFIITNYDNGEFVLSDEYKGEYGAE
ncbi:PL29 family lyase N-terminal domain-containing protein [Phocaeicola plebeius]|uniref:PL29 family lyase N-terminal domain-containing protein n=1 Tax=Phocaeicola plebeius TaxID=310297 RepID=UPI00307D4AF1